MILLMSPEIYWKEDLFILFSAELTAGVWITVSSTDWASWQTLIRAPVTRAALHITQHQESVGLVSGTNSLQCPHWLHNTYNTPYTYTTLHTPVDSFTFPSELMLIWLKSCKLLLSSSGPGPSPKNLSKNLQRISQRISENDKDLDQELRL